MAGEHKNQPTMRGTPRRAQTVPMSLAHNTRLSIIVFFDAITTTIIRHC